MKKAIRGLWLAWRRSRRVRSLQREIEAFELWQHGEERLDASLGL